MKKINILTLFICVFSLASAGVAGLCLKHKTANEVDAINGVGSVTIDTTINWSSAECKVAIYFYDSNNASNTAWSNLVHMDAGQSLVTVPYSLSFTPDYMIAVRYNPAFSQNDWESDPWGSNPSSYGWADSPKWNQTNNLQIIKSGLHIRITDSNWAELDDYAALVTNDYTVDLINLKINDYGHCEYYQDPEMWQGEKFKILFAGQYYNSYTTYASISENFSVDLDGYIVIEVAGSYTFFFDATTKTIYITSPSIAAADQWSELFLGNVGCDPNGVAAPTGWDYVAASYSSLGAEVKNYIYGASASTSGSATQRALATYEWALAHNPHNLTPFITNGDGSQTRGLAMNRTIGIGLKGNAGLNSTALIIAIISLIGVSSIVSYLYLRKRKDSKLD